MNTIFISIILIVVLVLIGIGLAHQTKKFEEGKDEHRLAKIAYLFNFSNILFFAVFVIFVLFFVFLINLK